MLYKKQSPSVHYSFLRHTRSWYEGLPMKVRGVTIAYCLMAITVVGWSQGKKKTTTKKNTISQSSSIVDDTTRLIYGAKTSMWISEKELFFQRDKHYHRIDTSVRNFHWWTYPQRFNNKYKNLGNVGTALYPVFPLVPSTLGVSTGFTVYNPYYQTQDPSYFDTKSPYSHFRLIWADDGRATTSVGYSRNINPQLNVGFNFRAMLPDKQIQRTSIGDKQVRSYYYDLYGSFKTKNERYRVIINFRRLRHRVLENGGVSNVNSGDNMVLFSKSATPVLTKAFSEELRISSHVLQQYSFFKEIELYYDLNIDYRFNTYVDDLSVDPNDFYDPQIVIVEDNKNHVFDHNNFLSITNRIGIKGTMGKFFYDAYVKVRPYHFSYKHITQDTLAIPLVDVEYSLGGRVSFDYDSLNRVEVAIEYLFPHYYRMKAEVNTRWVDLKAVHIVTKPPFIFNAKRGPFDLWDNDFLPTRSTQLEVFGKISTTFLLASAGITFTALENYIYFRKEKVEASAQQVLPVQSSGKQLLLSPEVRFDITFLRHIHFRPQGIYAFFMENEGKALSVPQLFLNAQLTYENRWFKNHFDFQFGVDVHWKSDYFDYAYDPAIQQFYVQSDTVTPSFFLLDIFLNGKIGKTRFFFRYNNLMQAILNTGNLATPPNYPGIRNVVEFSFQFTFFD